jgi:hypothetical protein
MKFFENVKGTSLGSRSISFDRRQQHLNQNIAPLGISERKPLVLGYDPADPHGKAKDSAIRFLNFVRQFADEVHPADIIFGIRLFALNEYNSNELVSLTEVSKEAILAAKNYYTQVQATRKKVETARPSSNLKKDPGWEKGILLNKRLVMFAQILIREHDLSPFDFIYAIELFILNIKGMPTFPLSLEEQHIAEEAADEYYTKSLSG